MFRVASTEEYDQWFAGQGDEVATEVFAVVGLLQEFGHRLSRPHADTINGSKFDNMKELRVKTSRAEIRIAFAFDPKRNAILLIAGDKRGSNEKRFYRQLIAKADLLYEKHLKVIHG